MSDSLAHARPLSSLALVVARVLAGEGDLRRGRRNNFDGYRMVGRREAERPSGGGG
jgi:hypothetical protein